MLRSMGSCQLQSHVLLAATWETSQHVNSEVWAPAIPRALCYIEKQPHMIDKAAWESYGQFRPLGAARNGCAAPAKRELEFHSINRESCTLIHSFTSAITHTTFRFHHPPQREKRASCKGGELAAVLGTTLLPASFSLLFIPSMYLLSSVFIVMSS